MEDAQRKAIQETFNTIASGYDSPSLRFFTNAASMLPEFLDLKGDEMILDVGTGTGNAAFALAPFVPQGLVTGIDFSEGMVAQAKAKAESAGVSNVRFVEMDMQQLSLPTSNFDVVVSSFSIFFVEEMEAQLKQFAALVKPGGKLLLTAFEESNFQPLVDLMYARLAKYGVTQPLMIWKRIASVSLLTAFLENAGLQDVRVVHRNVGYPLPSAEGWWEIIWNAGFRRMVNQLTPSDQQAFRKEHLEEVKAVGTEVGIQLNVEVLFAVATKR